MDSIEILQRIVAADKEARVQYETAKQKNVSADVRSDTLRKEMTERAMEKAREDVENEKQRLLDEANAEAVRLSDENDRRLAEMQQQFSAHKDEYAEKMFRMAVGLE